MSKIGYARVSTRDQKLDLQTDALKKAGCEKIFSDTGISGAKASRPGLDDCLDYMRQGDTLVVWKLDRLGRSTKNLLTLISDIEARGIGFQSVTEALDTSTPQGRLFFTIASAFTQMERELIQERVMEGLKAARARGRLGGRRKRLTPSQEAKIRTLYDKQELKITEIAELFNISRATVYRALDNTATRTQREEAPTN